MKPLKLSIEGLKSISETQTVDFEVLSESGIFGIFGKTGSGKSTILDAIVLAVYGEVIEGLKSSEFINVGCEFARVELKFAIKRGGNEETYEVERKFKFNKARTAVTQSASLKKIEPGGEKICLAENALSVTALLKNEIIGLEKSDFLKCIALPQGEFAAFVKMTRGERLAVIGKLFDLTKYGEELALKVKRRQEDLKLENERLQGKLEALACPSEQEVEADDFALKKLAEKERELKVALEKNERESEKAKALKQTAEDIQKKTNELNEKSGYRSIIEQKRQKLGEYSKAKTVKGALDVFNARSREKEEAAVSLVKLEELLKQTEARFDLAKTKKQENDVLSEQAVELKVKIKGLDGLKDKNQELLNKKAQRNKLLEEFSALFSSARAQIDRAESLKKRIESLKIELGKIDTNGVLSELKKDVASSAVGKLAAEEIEFLKELGELVSTSEVATLKKDESAVNGLIAARIEQLSLKISAEKFDADELITKAAAAIKKSAEISGELQKCNAEVLAAESLFADYSARAELIKQEGVKVRAECDGIGEEIKNALGGLGYEVAAAKFSEELEKIQKTIEQNAKNYELAYAEKSKLEGEYSAAKTRLSLSEKLLAESSENLNAELSSKGLTLEQATLALDYPDAEKDEELVKCFDTDVKVLEISLGELNKKAAAFDEKYRNYDEIFLLSENIREKLSELNKKHGELSVKHKNDLKNLRERCIIVEKAQTVSGKLDLLGRLLETVKAGRFMEFIADEYLQEIASDAEIRVLELTGGRYGLIYDGNFFVTDNFSGGIKRPVAGLSGGETFIVSLCLALSLSKQISAKALRPIDFFFLDEGFGTLDEDLVDAVTTGLEKLRALDFTVGLITHVSELKNRIASKLYVHGATCARGTVIELSPRV